MGRFLAIIVVLNVAVVVPTPLLKANLRPNLAAQSASTSDKSHGSLPTLPPVPTGKPTVIGGTIREVDPVRDQLTLKVFGGGRMKVLFDERTQFYRDGRRASLGELGPEAHASVETVLDGTNVFALSIHVLSHAPQGECDGQVVRFDPGTGNLTVNPVLSNEPLELRVPPGTPMVRTGQAAVSSSAVGVADLVKGTLVSLKFVAGEKGRGVVRHIAILATPGSAFVFSGNIAFLDLHAHRLALVDPRDGESYRIVFDPARFPMSHQLREGEHVRVTANFDGSHYVASAITVQ